MDRQVSPDRHCIANAVARNEHGNLLDAEAAAVLAERRALLVPTLITYEVMRRKGSELGLNQFSAEKLEQVLDAGLRSVEVALNAGVSVGFGTDLLGELHEYQSEEFLLRAQVQKPHEVVAAATTVNAAILGMSGKLGVIAPGAFADLIAVRGNPFGNLGLLQEQGRHLDLIMKAGQIVKMGL